MNLLSNILIYGGLGAILGVLISSVIWSKSYGGWNDGGGGFDSPPIPPSDDPIPLNEDEWDNWLRSLNDNTVETNKQQPFNSPLSQDSGGIV